MKALGNETERRTYTHLEHRAARATFTSISKRHLVLVSQLQIAVKHHCLDETICD